MILAERKGKPRTRTTGGRRTGQCVTQLLVLEAVKNKDIVYQILRKVKGLKGAGVPK